MNKINYISKEGAASQILERVLETEREHYIEYCMENDWNVENIRGLEQSTHIYALALIALGLDFEKGEDYE